ncbi:MAG: hypothetical protein WC948_02975 [Thermovirgaceae bacterium]
MIGVIGVIGAIGAIGAIGVNNAILGFDQFQNSEYLGGKVLDKQGCSLKSSQILGQLLLQKMS